MDKCFCHFNGYEVKDAYARKRISNNAISPEMFGAKGDGVTDDTTALQNAINHCVENNVALLAYGNYLFSQSLSIHGEREKTTKIQFYGDLTYTGEDFAFIIDGEYVSLTLAGDLTCTVGSGIKVWDNNGTKWTAFNKIEFFTITTQGNGIEFCAVKNGVYNNDVTGTNIGRFSRGGEESTEDGSCGVKFYVPDGVPDAPFVSQNICSIRWIHGFHYGMYNGYGENGTAKFYYVGDNQMLYTSFETNRVGVALINAHAHIEKPRMAELRSGRCAYYVDGDWRITGDADFNLGLVKFGSHILPSENGVNLTNGYGVFEPIEAGTLLWSKSGIYIPAGCRQAWAFNLDYDGTPSDLWVNEGYPCMVVPRCTDNYTENIPADRLANVKNYILHKPYKKFTFNEGATGNIVLGKMFYNYYNINSIEIALLGTSTAERYVYYGDGTLLLTIPAGLPGDSTATIKWEQGGSDENAFTPTVVKSW